MTIGAVILMMRMDALFCRQVCSSSQTTLGARFRAVRAKRLDEPATAVPVSGGLDGDAAFVTRRTKNRLNEKSTFADQAAGL
jgi:non-canonical (house-cleaning) NTP pyrophosphatase